MCFLLFLRNLFNSCFMFIVKLRGWYKNFPYSPFFKIYIASYTINITHQNAHFYQDEPILTNHNYPNPLFNLGFILSVVEPMYLDMCTMTSTYYNEYFHCLIKPLSSAKSSLLPSLTQDTTDFFYLCNFAFSRMLYS